jgi:hypothetical protein
MEEVMIEENLISFIVIAYNEEANLANSLSAITGLADLGDYEIIVVNDGSRDRTAQVARDIAGQNPSVRLIDLGENRGRGHARHRGVAAARGGLIATVDADIILPRHWLIETRAALRNYDAVGGVAVPDGDVAYLYRRFKLVPRVVSGTTAVTGNNGLYRRAVFEVTSFDESLREGEDSALNHAMGRRGLSAVTLPGLLVHHEEKKTLVTSLQWLFDVGRGATRQLLTYGQVRPPDLVTAAFAGSLALGVCAAVRKHPLLGAAIPVVFVLSASLQHVRSRFETPRSQWPRVAPAVAVDSAHLAAYFAGRLAGLATLAPRQPSHRTRGRDG